MNAQPNGQYFLYVGLLISFCVKLLCKAARNFFKLYEAFCKFHETYLQAIWDFIASSMKLIYTGLLFSLFKIKNEAENERLALIA